MVYEKRVDVNIRSVYRERFSVEKEVVMVVIFIDNDKHH